MPMMRSTGSRNTKIIEITIDEGARPGAGSRADSSLAAEESLPILPAAMLEPVAENCYRLRDPHSGETPMMRTWKMLGLNTLLAALFAASPGFARDTSALSSDAEKLEGIQKQLNELK